MVWYLRLIHSVLFLALTFPAAAQSKTLFEGYYKVLAGSAHVGYVVQRFEFDNKSKEFTSTYYIRTNKLGGNMTESLKAKANEQFQPISYQYTTQANGSVKMISAKFKGQNMTAFVTDGQNKQTITRKLPKGTFLSTFLGYLMLSNGYKAGKKFTYSAVAEEDAEAYSGEAYIKETVKQNGKDVFRILNTFKGAKFVSYVTPKGEVLKTESPVQQVATELVAESDQATAGMPVGQKSLSLLFGGLPLGRENSYAKKASSAAPKPQTTDTKGP